MERFLKRHESRIVGTIAGFDRVLFSGTLRSISYVKGLEIFLSTQGVLHKHFADFAQRLSDSIKEHAKAIAVRRGRPVEYITSPSVSKEDRAREIMERDGISEGLICVLTCLEPCRSFSIRKDRYARKLALVSEQRKCLHIYFYWVDPQFGLMHVRVQTWIPFTIHVCINGRSWLAKQMDRAGIKYTRRDNCFTHIEDVDAAQQLMDSLSEQKWARFLNSLAKRLNPILGRRSCMGLRGYYWSLQQCEFATDVMFKDEQSLASIYPRLARHAIEEFSCRDVLRFLGRRVCDGFQREVNSSFKMRFEGLRVKHWVDENSIKMYDKQGSVLRVETTINNARRFKVRRRTMVNGREALGWVPMRKGIADLRRRIELSRSANGRYLEALAVVGEITPSHRLLDPLSRRLIIRNRSYRPLHPISPSDSRVFHVFLKGDYLIQGCRNRDLLNELEPGAEKDQVAKRRASARISRLLSLMRAHGLIYKVPKTHLHRITKMGHEVMSTAIKFRCSDVALLAA